jgi:hypothetical protein
MHGDKNDEQENNPVDHLSVPFFEFFHAVSSITSLKPMCDIGL